MNLARARRLGPIAAAALVAVTTAGCIGGSGGAAAPSGATSVASTGTATDHPTIPATGLLTKTQYLGAMNADCRDTSRELQALPIASSPTDYTALHDYSQAVLRILPSFLAQATALTARSADQAEITAKWLSIERSDYAQVSPVLQQMVVSAGAHNAAQVKSLNTFLDQTPSHSSQIEAFMNSYGLDDCANLEAG